MFWTWDAWAYGRRATNPPERLPAQEEFNRRMSRVYHGTVELQRRREWLRRYGYHFLGADAERV